LRRNGRFRLWTIAVQFFFAGQSLR
jgi:hypothetical protein